MNILLIIILVVFALSVFGGYRKGFLKTVFSLVSWMIVLFLCNYASPIVTNVLIEQTDIEVVVQTTVDAKISEVIKETIETSGVGELEATLPAGLKETLMGEEGNLQDAVVNGIALDTTSLVTGIVGILGFVITVLVLRIVMMIAEIALGLVSKLPVIGPLDKVLGLVCGIGQGLIWCWIILAFVSVLALTGVNTEFATYISQSEVLTWLQDNNVLLNLIVDIK